MQPLRVSALDRGEFLLAEFRNDPLSDEPAFLARRPRRLIWQSLGGVAFYQFGNRGLGTLFLPVSKRIAADIDFPP